MPASNQKHPAYSSSTTTQKSGETVRNKQSTTAGAAENNSNGPMKRCLQETPKEEHWNLYSHNVRSSASDSEQAMRDLEQDMKRYEDHRH
ncbi:MAG: hypothetical protein MMC23_000310 [Stictis urceolatum]|nr:hypothetical protein [Stictis urceolata]